LPLPWLAKKGDAGNLHNWSASRVELPVYARSHTPGLWGVCVRPLGLERLPGLTHRMGRAGVLGVWHQQMQGCRYTKAGTLVMAKCQNEGGNTGCTEMTTLVIAPSWILLLLALLWVCRLRHQDIASYRGRQDPSQRNPLLESSWSEGKHFGHHQGR